MNARPYKNTLSHTLSPAASGCGENLYMSSNKKSWSDAIQSWFDEVKDFQYGVGSINGKDVGHYTQVHSLSINVTNSCRVHDTG